MNYDIISIEDGFQYSINIAYDLHNEKKLRSFIPTKSSLKLIEEVILSTKTDSTDRARVLVGAYGKGKSHIVLSILSLLSGTPLEIFEKLNNKIIGSNLQRIIQDYQERGTKLLPILITGTGSSITQSFLLALQRTLSENDLLGLMPDTNFKAAVKTIERWENEYPSTFENFKKSIGENIIEFKQKLKDFDNETYRKFEEIYPSLTSGGTFNPFLGFDVTEIYESVVKSLREKTQYSGLYVVYDEFSKYLESNIVSASVNDTKMLQDFAEKCNRSGDNQLHLMLICHKEISNYYVENLSKQKLDGWRGISERFSHKHLNNNFSQTYEIIESVIIKNSPLYQKFVCDNKANFDNLVKIYSSDTTYNDIDSSVLQKIFEGCYPLHPISTYILPRLSERVAQNERTLFTFLSAPGTEGLPAHLDKLMELGESRNFHLFTPDVLYDYFEPLFKKEVYTEDLYKIYTLTTILLDKLDETTLEAKIVKTLSLIYILSQFERLAPTSTTLNHIFGTSYSSNDIDNALKNLVEKECIVYLKRSNNFYSLKQSSGIDINEQIQKIKNARESHFILKDILNACNFEKALYPLRYNDEKEITRYFTFTFINEKEISPEVNWRVKSSKYKADGVIYAILPSQDGNLINILEALRLTKESSGRCLFIIPNNLNENQRNISEFAKEYDAVKTLLENVGDDNILKDEYEVILGDLQEIILDFIAVYTQSEKNNATYIYEGEKIEIRRKADVTEQLSVICERYFSNTPIIINESVNKNTISATATNARNKIISSLLRTELEKNLGLVGGQELAIMRSLLTKTGVIDTENDFPSIHFNIADKKLENVLNMIKNFTTNAKEKTDFSSLYEDLTTDKERIGLRRGLIPVYIACVFHEYKKQISIYRGVNELPLATETICAINDNPENFTIKFMDWSEKEDDYIENLANLFGNYIRDSEKGLNAYDFVFNAIRRWYMDLPKYAKEMKTTFDRIAVPKEYLNFLKNIKSATNIQEFLFEKLRTFNTTDELAKAKQFYDRAVNNAILVFGNKVCELFGTKENISQTLKNWADNLNEMVYNIVFADRTSQFIKICINTEVSEDINNSLSRQIAYLATDLSIEDWNDSTLENALNNIRNFKKNAEEENTKINFDNNVINDNKTADTNSFEINFVSSDGKTKTKRFEKSEKTSKGIMLSRSLKNNLDGMGLAVSDKEKRQVLMELLLELCGED